MSLLAVDPGTTVSGWVILDGKQIAASGVDDNNAVLGYIRDWQFDVAIERFEARGMAISDDSVETILWTGRFIQVGTSIRCLPYRVKRSEVKLHLCGTTQAKDPNVRQALIDIFGPKGVKANPGGTFGVSSHAWAALGVAATVRGLR